MASNLNDREVRLLITAWGYCSGGDYPKVDFDKLAEMLEYKNATSVMSAYSRAKKKVVDAASAASHAPKASGQKRKVATEDGLETLKPKKQCSKKAETDVGEDDKKKDPIELEKAKAKIKDEYSEDEV